MSKEVMTIIRKELKRVFTDRRLVFTSFILPALSIALMYSVMGMMVNNNIEDIEAHWSEVAIINQPSILNEHIDFDDYSIYTYNINPIGDGKITELLLEAKYDAVVVFEEDFDSKILDQANELPSILVHRNKTEEYSNEAYSRLNSLLEELRYDILLTRVENEAFVEVFEVDRENELDIADEKKLGSQGFGMIIPMLIGIFLFTGAMSIGMDSIAGEKERGTMATLLVTPIKRTDIIIGKLISLSVVALISTISSFTGIFLSLPFSGYMFGQTEGEIMGGFSSFTVFDAGMILIVMLGLVGIYVGLITAISMHAKSVKEAGTYMAPVYMVIMMTSIFNMMNNGTAEIWRFAIPVYGNIMALKSVFLGEAELLFIMVSFGSSVIFTGVLINIIRKMFSKESVMFPN